MELRRIHSELNVSTLLVTHSQEEALVMSDRIAVMRRGRIEAIDSPGQVYNRPPNRFVCTFVGDANILECVVKRVSGGEALLERSGLQFAVDAPAGIKDGDKLSVAIRPENVGLQREATGAAAHRAKVVDTIFKGSHISYVIAAGADQIQVLTLPPLDGSPFAPGEDVHFTLPKSRIIPLAEDAPDHG